MTVYYLIKQSNHLIDLFFLLPNFLLHGHFLRVLHCTDNCCIPAGLDGNICSKLSAATAYVYSIFSPAAAYICSKPSAATAYVYSIVSPAAAYICSKLSAAMAYTCSIFSSAAAYICSKSSAAMAYTCSIFSSADAYMCSIASAGVALALNLTIFLLVCCHSCMVRCTTHAVACSLGVCPLFSGQWKQW